MFKFFKSKTVFRIPTVALIAAVAVLAGGAIVWGVIVSDTFTTTDDVAATWRTTVATSTGEVTLEEQSCDNGAWFCDSSSVCANYGGDGNGLLVYRTDVSVTKQWKTTNTACDPPQCSTVGGQNGDNLVVDNTVTFGTTYPAREACKVIGGRLPTKDELLCIFTNRTTLGDNFLTNSNYWSSTESGVGYAWYVSSNTGLAYSDFYSQEINSYRIRCVRGWSR